MGMGRGHPGRGEADGGGTGGETVRTAVWTVTAKAEGGAWWGWECRVVVGCSTNPRGEGGRRGQGQIQAMSVLQQVDVFSKAEQLIRW